MSIKRGEARPAKEVRIPPIRSVRSQHGEGDARHSMHPVNLYKYHLSAEGPCAHSGERGDEVGIEASVAMGQKLAGMWDRARGMLRLQRICDHVFHQFAVDGKLPLSNLHLAILSVYIDVNKYFLSPFKEPPSKTMVDDKLKDLQSKGPINHEQFFQLIEEWMHKDMLIVLISRMVLAILAAPAMAIVTKNAAKRVPRIQHVVEKVPTPVFIPAYAVALLFLQDVGMNYK